MVEESTYYGAEWSGGPAHLGRVKPGGKWLGLYELGNGKYTLIPCSVSYKKFSGGEDGPPKVRIDLTPRVKNKPPLFAVKAGLSAGAVSTVFYRDYSSDQTPFIVDGKRIERGSDEWIVRLGNRKYTVKLASVGNWYDKDRQIFVIGTWVLVMEYRGRKQILESWRRIDDGYPLWMGDLDRDGKLDLYVAVEGHGGYWERYLFLSSWAEPYEIAGRVGGFADSFVNKRGKWW